MINAGPMIIVTCGANTSLAIENNTFSSITIYGSFSLVTASTSVTASPLSYSITGNTFKNIYTDSLFAITANTGVISNNTFTHIYTNTSTTKTTGLARMTFHSSAIFTNNIITNSVIYYGYFASIISCTSVSFYNLELQNVTSLGFDLFYFESNT